MQNKKEKNKRMEVLQPLFVAGRKIMIKNKFGPGELWSTKLISCVP